MKENSPLPDTSLNNQPCWWASWNVTCISSPFKYFICSCLKGETAWTKRDVKTKAQRICGLKLQLLFFWTSAENWIHLLEMEYLVSNSACELVMLEFKAWFISFCTCFHSNADYRQDTLHSGFLPSWESGLILSRETFLKCTSVTAASGNTNYTYCFIYLSGILGFLSCVS